jgi:hypothetical protein
MTVGPKRAQCSIASIAPGIESVRERVVHEEARHRQQVRVARMADAILLERPQVVA